MTSVVTISDVAHRAGVSISTVSRVLSPGINPHPVNVATAERVREAARELNFVPSALARGLVARRSGLIGLVVPDLTDPHYPHIASGVEDAARDAELAILICNTLGDPARLTDYLRVLRSRRVDAIVLSGGASLGPRELSRLTDGDVPVVVIGRPASPTGLAYVTIDNVQAARAATQHLIDMGRQRVAHLAGPQSQTTMADRAEGFMAAVRAVGRPLLLLRTDGSPEHGYETVSTAMQASARERPDAIFAATDRLAIAALAAALDVGRQVPTDLALVGFDNIPLNDYLRPSLSSVNQPARELGLTAIQLALRLAAGESVDPVILPAELIIRGSSAR
jgi:DNA-binding LacI/PurR family transcriptional regulator